MGKTTIRLKWISVIASLALVLVGCSAGNDVTASSQSSISEVVSQTVSSEEAALDTGTDNKTEDYIAGLEGIPTYSGEPYAIINENNPSFSEADLTDDVFEEYSPLDDLGRCGVAYANLCKELMPTEDRESISSVTPSGWVNHQYDFVDGGYLYNRCHLIGFQLAGENANEENLITGTRYMNVNGMLPFENMVADYITESVGAHVLYRVTPIYEGDNLVASGVQLEAESVEDQGQSILFNVFCYNVQPGVEIDYATGENWAVSENQDTKTDTNNGISSPDIVEIEEYVLNTKSQKFHFPSCSGAQSISEENKQIVYESREDLISEGYSPCKLCNP